jgi:hypothetical protein
MKKLAILGVLVMIIPFLGFPNTWDSVIYPLVGFIILMQSIYFLRKLNPILGRKEKKLPNNVYVENSDCSIKGE